MPTLSQTGSSTNVQPAAAPVSAPPASSGTPAPTSPAQFNTIVDILYNERLLTKAQYEDIKVKSYSNRKCRTDDA